MVFLVTCIHVNVFSLFEALNGAFEVQFFSGLHFYTLSKTLIACTCSSDFFKVKTLLNDAFNYQRLSTVYIYNLTLSVCILNKPNGTLHSAQLCTIRAKCTYCTCT